MGSYKTRRYEVVFRAHFARSPDEDIPVYAAIVSCTRLLPSDPSKGTPPASERGSVLDFGGLRPETARSACHPGSVLDLTQTSLHNVDPEVIGHAIESL